MDFLIDYISLEEFVVSVFILEFSNMIMYYLDIMVNNGIEFVLIGMSIFYGGVVFGSFFFSFIDIFFDKIIGRVMFLIFFFLKLFFDNLFLLIISSINDV